MTKQDMDKHSAGYLKYQRERYEFDKQVLKERAEYDPKNPDAIHAILKGRNKALGDLGHTHAELGKIGLGQITPMPWEIVPPYGVPWQGYIDTVFCDLRQTLNIENATYVVLDSDPGFDEHAIPPKSAYSQTSADPFWSDASGLIHNGYRTVISVPAADGVTSVTITSALGASFSWVEANAIGNGWVSHVSARGHAWLSGPSGFQAASPVTLVSFVAVNGQVLSHNDMPSTTLGAVFELSTSVPASNGATIDVFETIMLNAMTPNGHAYISGTFSWQPLSVTMSEGCRPIRIPRWGYWGRV